MERMLYIYIHIYIYIGYSNNAEILLLFSGLFRKFCNEQLETDDINRSTFFTSTLDTILPKNCQA